MRGRAEELHARIERVRRADNLNARTDPFLPKIVRTMLEKNGSELPRHITPTWVAENAHLVLRTVNDMGVKRTRQLLWWAHGSGVDVQDGLLECDDWERRGGRHPCRQCATVTNHHMAFCRYCLLPMAWHPKARAIIIDATRRRFEAALVQLDGELEELGG